MGTGAEELQIGVGTLTSILSFVGTFAVGGYVILFRMTANRWEQDITLLKASSHTADRDLAVLKNDYAKTVEELGEIKQGQKELNEKMDKILLNYSSTHSKD